MKYLLNRETKSLEVKMDRVKGTKEGTAAAQSQWRCLFI